MGKIKFANGQDQISQRARSKWKPDFKMRLDVLANRLKLATR